MKKLFRILKNPYLLSVITKILLVLLGFFYSVCQSRFLGAALKGDVAYLTSVTTITSIVFGCGIHQAYPYFKKKTGRDMTPQFMKLAVGMLFVYLILAALLSFLLKADPSLSAILFMTPCFVYHKIVAYISMVENPNKKHLTELYANVLELLLVIVLWLTVPPTLLIGVLIYVVKDLFLAGVYSWRLRSALRKPESLTAAQVSEILKFGLFPMLVLLMSTLNYRVDIIMLKSHVSSAEVGVYSVGVMLAERVWMIPDAMKEVMISNLAKGKGAEELGFVVRLCNSSCLFVVLAIVALGKPFIHLFFGSEYSGAYSVTVVILIGVIFMIYYKMIAAYNIVHGKQKENFFFLVISVICNIFANLLLIPRYGNIGAAMASILSYAVSAFLFTRRFILETNAKITDLLLINREDLNRFRAALKTKQKK